MEKKRWNSLVDPRKDWLHLARVSIVPGRVTRLHTHDFAEIFFVEKGRGVHGINGEKRRLDPGDLIFMRPADRHVLSPLDRAGFVLVNLAFPQVVVDDLRARHASLRKFHDDRARLPVRVRLDHGELASLQEEMNRLGYAGTGRLALERGLLNLYAMLTHSSRSPAPTLPDWLARAVEGIQRPEHFVEGPQAFFRLAGRNPEYVARTVRQMLGLTPTEFINRVRMEHAARELRLGGKPIIEIALECGLANLSHFYALFREAYHATPRQYRLTTQSSAT